ncbi:MAG: MBL fold metallo-hydrolase, partial [Acidobacteriota bacterium]
MRNKTSIQRAGALIAGVTLVLAGASACAKISAEQQVVRDAAAALGGVQLPGNARVVVLHGAGRNFNLGQDLRPGLAEQTFTVTAFSRAVDLDAPRVRTTLTRTPNFSYFMGPQAQTQEQGVDGEVAYNVGASGTPSRAALSVAAERRAERFHQPLVLLQAALADGASLHPATVAAGERGVVVDTAAGPVMLVVGADARPVRIESAGTQANLGDVRLITTFSNYQDALGLHLPTHLATAVDDFTTADYDVTYRAGEAEAVAAPEAVKAAAVPAAPTVNVAVTEVAPGVWFLAGQSHHSAVVAFKDHLVLFEAPQSEARALAVIAKARQLRPGVPLTHLVMTHHHFDHSAGLRAAIAEGLTVITHEGNQAFVAEIAARPFTRQPDALARTPKPLVVETVGDTRTISDGTRSLVLFHLAGNPHTDTLLMGYLPKERMLIEADAFSPEGGGYHPYALNLVEHIERLKLKVDRIVPLHGELPTMRELLAAARP